ncbi:MAG: iron export ABC transporter permease subunit FetB [Peptostreptococcaceae bacterium]|jgi:putative ABC transport system permease protein|nr:iron export ABC transporter permease subunit FetB [Peptostreptococcaceae bacterium]
MENVIDIEFFRMILAYLLIVIILIMVRLRGLNREKEIIISTIRMSLQLFLTGNILVHVFKNPSPIVTISIIFAMEIFAINNIYKRVKTNLSKDLKKIIALSMSVGTISSLLFFLLIIVNIKPWYNPRYFIPIAGMLIGNSMTGITLGVSKLVSSMNERSNLIESALMIGATPKMACKEIVDESVDFAILPTINSMIGMGIVFLPGMMSGQILSGISPITAIEYQIAIMLCIFFSVSLTVLLFVNLGYKTFFNNQSQLILE